MKEVKLTFGYETVVEFDGMSDNMELNQRMRLRGIRYGKKLFTRLFEDAVTGTIEGEYEVLPTLLLTE